MVRDIDNNKPRYPMFMNKEDRSFSGRLYAIDTSCSVFGITQCHIQDNPIPLFDIKRGTEYIYRTSDLVHGDEVLKIYPATINNVVSLYFNNGNGYIEYIVDDEKVYYREQEQ
jgi:hypothetical protein